MTRCPVRALSCPAMAPREPYDAHASPAGLRINLLGPLLVTLERAEVVAYVPPKGKGRIQLIGSRWFPPSVTGS